jgi:hypothetical protein
MRQSIVLLLLSLSIIVGRVNAGDSDVADLRLRIGSTEVLKYSWNISSASDSSGKEGDKVFNLVADSTFGMTLVMRGLPGKKDSPTAPVAIRIKDQSYTDKRSIEQSKTELYVAKGKVKYVENGKVLIDSDNDIGLDKIGNYQQQLKNLEGSEMRLSLDAAGRQSDVQGDAIIVEAIKNGGAQGIFPILAGKEVRIGESWEDSFSMPKIGDFTLAKPVVVRSKATFTKWEEKAGKKLARIDITSNWENGDLRGENARGMLVEISRVDGRGNGSCLFDTASGKFVEGTIKFDLRYRIDGEHNGQKSGLDVTGKTNFSFAEQP